MANRCNSPPESLSTSRSNTCSNSASNSYIPFNEIVTTLKILRSKSFFFISIEKKSDIWTTEKKRGKKKKDGYQDLW